MNIQDRLVQFTNATGLDIGNLITSVGDLNSLTTASKGNLVLAIEELRLIIFDAFNHIINDSVASTNQVYSSTKFIQLLDAAILTIAEDAPENYDTLKEIADWISNDKTQTTNILNQLNNKLRHDQTMSLTSAQILNVHKTIKLAEDKKLLVGGFLSLSDIYKNVQPYKDPYAANVVFDLQARDGLLATPSNILDHKGVAIQRFGDVRYTDACAMRSEKTIEFLDTAMAYLNMASNAKFNLGNTFSIEISLTVKSLPAIDGYAQRILCFGPDGSAGSLAVQFLFGGRVHLSALGANPVGILTPTNALQVGKSADIGIYVSNKNAHITINGNIVATQANITTQTAGDCYLKVGQGYNEYFKVVQPVQSYIDFIKITKGICREAGAHQKWPGYM